MPQKNAIEHEAKLFGEDLRKQIDDIKLAIVEPAPPFSVKLSDEEQLRIYGQLREVGPTGKTGLWLLRESNGGSRKDAEVDRYSLMMERRLAKARPDVIVREMVERGSIPPIDIPPEDEFYTPGKAWFEERDEEEAV